MEQQCFIQVRVDANLKREATEILEQVGLDMPAAIRMFLKRITMEKGLPFDVRIPTETENESDDKAKVVIRYPATQAKYVDYSEYIETLKLVPHGMLTRYEDIMDYLAKKHNAERIEIGRNRPLMDAYEKRYPYWRVVTTRGLLHEDRFLHSKEQQAELLIAEGHTIVPSGPQGKMLKVENYREYLFDFDAFLAKHQ